MKICRRGVGFMQVFNAQGGIRGCSWMKRGYMGNMLDEDIPAIMHGKMAEALRIPLLDGTYSNCRVDNCPYLANGTIESQLIDIDEIPDYPEMLFLAYEGVCNYKCTCCTSYQHMKDTKCHDYSEEYEILENKLREVLPHIKHINANGRGELFACKRILRLLSEWKPLAPVNEVSAGIETNGSLFDEKHWKQIENLGQYNFTVSITVMSFDEMVYQHLSGTSLPIRQIEDNLRFVKSLREKGVINFLELATVLQEENFREMPEFTRRCIEEFGADCVRIRPILPGGEYDSNIQWFMDVRNPEHPYYGQYRKVMDHPIFKHPKVMLWSGDYPSPEGRHPGIKQREISDRYLKINRQINCMLSEKNFAKKVFEYTNGKAISIYGIGTFGKLFMRLIDDNLEISNIYDKYTQLSDYKMIPVLRLGTFDETSINDVMIVTIFDCYEEVRKELLDSGFKGTVINLHDIFGEQER